MPIAEPNTFKTSVSFSALRASFAPGRSFLVRQAPPLERRRPRGSDDRHLVVSEPFVEASLPMFSLPSLARFYRDKRFSYGEAWLGLRSQLGIAKHPGHALLEVLPIKPCGSSGSSLSRSPRLRFQKYQLCNKWRCFGLY